MSSSDSFSLRLKDWLVPALSGLTVAGGIMITSMMAKKVNENMNDKEKVMKNLHTTL